MEQCYNELLSSTLEKFNECIRKKMLRRHRKNVIIKESWLKGFDFSLRVSLVAKNNTEIDHAILLGHQFLDGSYFFSNGAEQGAFEGYDGKSYKPLQLVMKFQHELLDSEDVGKEGIWHG